VWLSVQCCFLYTLPEQSNRNAYGNSSVLNYVLWANACVFSQLKSHHMKTTFFWRHHVERKAKLTLFFNPHTELLFLYFYLCQGLHFYQILVKFKNALDNFSNKSTCIIHDYYNILLNNLKWNQSLSTLQTLKHKKVNY